MNYDPEQIAVNATEWARRAGQIQLDAFRSADLGIETKSSVHDVVTRVDKACESYLIEKINSYYPDHGVLGEETGAHAVDADWVWVIDPLDGTNNYSQGLPIFCVSIGLQYKGETVVGVVFAPYIHEVFTAVKGKGAFLNGKPLQIGAKPELNQSVLVRACGLTVMLSLTTLPYT